MIRLIEIIMIIVMITMTITITMIMTSMMIMTIRLIMFRLILCRREDTTAFVFFCQSKLAIANTDCTLHVVLRFVVCSGLVHRRKLG